MIRNNTEGPVTLDCDYDITDEEKEGLVVKWYFNNQDQVYQWIPNQRPQDLGILKGKLNLDYQASPDAYKMYRALQIYQPHTNLSGRYLCKVSTLLNDAYKSGVMLVYCKLNKLFNQLSLISISLSVVEAAQKDRIKIKGSLAQVVSLTHSRPHRSSQVGSFP
jgi:hypothetical protein